jgi:hypothetical protein
MFDKRRAAAEAANHTTIGFFNGLGFLAAMLAIPFLLAHFPELCRCVSQKSSGFLNGRP